jgi:hypothetical protein
MLFQAFKMATAHFGVSVGVCWLCLALESCFPGRHRLEGKLSEDLEVFYKSPYILLLSDQTKKLLSVVSSRHDIMECYGRFLGLL